MAIININETNFESEVKNSQIPVLVDFYASWCTPCRTMSRVLEDVSEELGTAAKVVKIDVMNETELADEFHILSVPTMIVFKDGEVTDTIVGATGKSQILSVLR